MNGERLGRGLLRLDAVYCFGAGALAIALAAPLGRLLETPTAVLAAAGAATLVWAFVVALLARRSGWRPAVAFVAAANVFAAAAIVVLAAFAPATAAKLLLAAVAAEVAAFAAGQAVALRR